MANENFAIVKDVNNVWVTIDVNEVTGKLFANGARMFGFTADQLGVIIQQVQKDGYVWDNSGKALIKQESTDTAPVSKSTSPKNSSKKA